MAKGRSTDFPLTFYRGETRPKKFVYRPRNRSLPPINLNGFTVGMKIKPQGQTEIVFGSPEVAITNAAGGEITIAIPHATVTAWQFQNARYVVLLNGIRWLAGTVTVKFFYE